MSREIRRVPPDWKHPTRGELGWGSRQNEYQPMHRSSYAERAEEWMKEYAQYQAEEFDIGSRAYFWDYDPPPDKNHYREREWKEEEATAFQIYEDMSEGTPVSPVFLTEVEMRTWLLEQGHSEKATDRFIDGGYAFSMVIVGKQARIGIDSLNID